MDAKEADGKWTATWRVWMGASREQGQAQGDTPDALADAVMLGVSQRLSQRFVGSAGSASAQVLQIEGADLARYAEVSRLLEPMGAKLVEVQGNRLVYRVTASPEQLRAQLALARLQEAPAERRNRRSTPMANRCRTRPCRRRTPCASTGNEPCGGGQSPASRAGGSESHVVAALSF